MLAMTNAIQHISGVTRIAYQMLLIVEASAVANIAAVLSD